PRSQARHGRHRLPVLSGHGGPRPKGEGSRGDARRQGRERAGRREPGVMKALLRAVPQLLRMLGRLVADPRLPRSAKIALAAAAVYLASPLDLIPDFIPLVGYLDDALVVAVVLDGVLTYVDRALLLRYWPGTPESLDRLARAARLLAIWVPRRL